MQQQSGKVMAISPNAAAQFICQQSGWTATQLKLQKILYLAHMVHLGRGNGPLVTGHFEAWDYGPVHPNLYQKVKAFGAKPIPNIFWNTEPLSEQEAATLAEACDNLLPLSSGQLVQNTHWKNGAWAKNYVQGLRNIVIPEADIVEEYQSRMAPAVQSKSDTNSAICD